MQRTHVRQRFASWSRVYAQNQEADTTSKDSREKLLKHSDLETWRLSQTWQQVSSHRHLTSCMTILLLLQRFKREMKSNRMPDDGGRGRGRGPPPPPPHTNLEEYERKLSSAAHDDVFADSSDELSRR